MLMSNCDFLVISSLSEALVVVLVEALASGKPVLSTRWGGADEVVNQEVGILVDKASAEALCRGVDWMLDHYQDYDPQAIAEYAYSQYSYEAIAEQFDNVYHIALARKH